MNNEPENLKWSDQSSTKENSTSELPKEIASAFRNSIQKELDSILDTSSRHEAGDRIHVCISHFNEHVLNHRYISDRPGLSGLANEVEDKMRELYQEIWKSDE